MGASHHSSNVTDSIGSDGHKLSFEEAKLQHLASLKVRLFHTKKETEVTGSDYSKPAEVGIVSEKALKGKTISHGVG